MSRKTQWIWTERARFVISPWREAQRATVECEWNSQTVAALKGWIMSFLQGRANARERQHINTSKDDHRVGYKDVRYQWSVLSLNTSTLNKTAPHMQSTIHPHSHSSLRETICFWVFFFFYLWEHFTLLRLTTHPFLHVWPCKWGVLLSYSTWSQAQTYSGMCACTPTH